MRLPCGDYPESLSVAFAGDKATAINPYFGKGVTVTITGADVVVANTNIVDEYVFELSGATSAGSFLYDASFKSTLVLNGVSIHNPKGPAIDIQCGKRVVMEIAKGTENVLTDGVGGDWKAALYCKGHLELDKSGTLTVTGNTKHAISSKEYMQLKKSDGIINILGAMSDGFHCSQYFVANGFTVNIDNKNGDGIQVDATDDPAYAEEYPDGSLWIQGGTFNIRCSGDGVCGLKADGDIVVNKEKGDPVIQINMTGVDSKPVKSKGQIKDPFGLLNWIIRKLGYPRYSSCFLGYSRTS